MNTLHMAVAHKQKEIVELLLKVKFTFIKFSIGKKYVSRINKDFSRNFPGLSFQDHFPSSEWLRPKLSCTMPLQGELHRYRKHSSDCNHAETLVRNASSIEKLNFILTRERVKKLCFSTHSVAPELCSTCTQLRVISIVDQVRNFIKRYTIRISNDTNMSIFPNTL